MLLLSADAVVLAISGKCAARRRPAGECGRPSGAFLLTGRKEKYLFVSD
jgi:hypothetical protein